MENSEIVSKFLEKGILLGENAVEYIQTNNLPIDRILLAASSSKIPVLTLDTLKSFNPLAQVQQTHSSVNIISSYKEAANKKDVQDFVSYFNARYKAIEKILRNRSELKNIISISRIQNKKDNEEIAIIGMVRDKATTAKGNILLELEDSGSSIKVVVNQTKKEEFALAKDIVLDEVIGVVGSSGQNIVFANSIILPDVPAIKEVKKASPQEGDFVFFDTGMSKHYHESEYYDNYPEMSVEIADYLMGRKVKAVGIDMCSPDHAPFPFHKILLGNNILIIENLTNLEALAGKKFTVFAFPLRLALDGSPVRVVAEIK